MSMPLSRRCEYLTYATNVERQYIKRIMKDVPDEYKKRWCIDNNFKSDEQIRAYTCRQNHAIRVFMFFFYMIACNLRYTAVRKINKVLKIKFGRHAKKI